MSTEQLFISDSLCYEIETEDVYKDMREMVDLLDKSNYVEDHPLFFNKNKKKRLKNLKTNSEVSTTFQTWGRPEFIVEILIRCNHICQKYSHILKYIFSLTKNVFIYEEFEDTKRAIRNRISKNRQHNGQKKKYKRKNNDRQNIQIKLKIE